jgi:hypothetical protein
MEILYVQQTGFKKFHIFFLGEGGGGSKVSLNWALLPDILIKNRIKTYSAHHTFTESKIHKTPSLGKSSGMK